MACYHPLWAHIEVDQAGKPVLNPDGKKYVWILKDYHPSDDAVIHDPSLIQLPCGKCIGCRLEYSRQWANRLMLELEYHDSAYFVTLTYNDFCVPKGYYADPETGEAMESMTLCKRDVQLFMKRLRKAREDDRIRFYCAGEYGPSTMRPHYHMILFGLHLDDLELKATDARGFRYYSSPLLERCWSRKGSIISPYTYIDEATNSFYTQLGFVTVANVTWETCAYTARYVTKKLTGDDAEFYADFGLTPPFSLMSRRPGIARQWYEDHPGWSDYDYINIKTGDGGRRVSPPKYFERLLGEDDPELAAQRAEIRAARARASIENKLSKTDLSYGQYLEVAERRKEAATKSLKRGL